MRKRCLLSVLLFVLVAGGLRGAASAVTMRLANLKVTEGSIDASDTPITLSGRSYGDWFALPGGRATLDVRGMESFTCVLGSSDGEHPASIEVDGDKVWSGTVRSGSTPFKIDIKLAGKQALTLRGDQSVWATARVVKASADTSSPPTATAPETGVSTPAPSSGRFSLDPSGLDRLADSLYKECTKRPAVKERVDNGRISVSTFRTIGGIPKEISESVGEDLSTALIKGGFSLAERGQVDKILAELKIQDTALVDQSAAQKIGKLSGCDLILLGSIADQESLVVINVRLMETATGNSVAAERIELRKVRG